jgi:hypothetical protein
LIDPVFEQVQRDLRPGGRDESSGFGAVRRFADQLDVRMPLQQESQALAEDRLILHEHDADGVHPGSSRCSRNPCCPVRPAVSVPPASASSSSPGPLSSSHAAPSTPSTPSWTGEWRVDFCPGRFQSAVEYTL